MNTVDLSDEQVFPIQRLYPEILAEIFTFCLSTDDAGINHAPLLLCNVCSWWRALAISTPPLWTYLKLRFESLADSNTQSVVDGIHTWLGRSGALPLTILLCCSEERVAPILDVCNALSTYASRWKNVDVAVPSIILSSWPDVYAVPLLRALRIRSPFHRTLFPSAPCLERVYLFSVPSTVLPHVPWHQLVELAITEWESNDTILRLIVGCPLLNSIDVRIAPISPYFQSGSVRVPVEHANLRNIKFCFFHDKYTILESLVVPALKSLSLCDDAFMENRACHRLYSSPLVLLKRSDCKLRELHLLRCYFDWHQVMESRSCRTLTSLRIENYGRSANVSNEHLLRLTHVDGEAEEFLCPELTHLVLTYCYPGRTSAGVLGRMILSRSRKTERSRLGSFELFIDPHSDFAETDRVLLKRAEENGLKLCINNFIKWRCPRDE